MAITDLRQTVIQIINEVQRMMGYSTTTTLTENATATLYVRFLNDTVSELADLGNWQEQYTVEYVTAQSSVAEYSLNVNNLIQSIYEIRWRTNPAPLEVRPIEDMRRLLALGGSYGTPRQFAVTGVDSSTGQPKISVYPVPTTAATFDLAYHLKPNLLTTSDAATTPIYPANVLIQGVYEKALLDENGGEPTRQWEAAFQRYDKMRQEALNRFTSDTGTNIFFTPQRGSYR